MLAGCWQSYGERLHADADMPAIEEPTSYRHGRRAEDGAGAGGDNRFSMTGIDSEGAPYTDELRFDGLKGQWYPSSRSAMKAPITTASSGSPAASSTSSILLCDENELAFPGVIDDLGDWHRPVRGPARCRAGADREI